MITLATLAQASAQEVFDQVKDHLLSQNRTSMLGDSCAYRGEYGLQCAAGCLMSDEEASKLIQTSSWYVLTKHEQVPQKHKGLIENLQDIHDGERPEEWPESLQRLAFDEHLTY